MRLYLEFTILQATGQEIPLVVTSCIRVINLHGML